MVESNNRSRRLVADNLQLVHHARRNDYKVGLSFQRFLRTALVIGIPVLLACSTIAIALGVTLNNKVVAYVGLSFLAPTILLMTNLLTGPRLEPLQPINVAAVTLLFGTSARSIYLATSNTAQAHFLMMGMSFESAIGYMPWLVAATCSVSIGYLVSWRFPLERLAFFRDLNFSRIRLRLVSVAFLVVTFIGTYLFIKRFGISLSDGLSALSYKRPVEYIDATGNVTYGTGYEALLAEAALFVLVMLTTVFIARRIRLHLVDMCLVACAAVLSIIVPFLSSNRTVLLMPLFSMFILAYFYNRVSLRSSLISLAIVVISITWLGEVRNFNQLNSADSSGPIAVVLGSGNGVDFMRISSIMDRVPRMQAFQNGKTYAAVISSWIPRSAWPDKPEVGLGAWVKRNLFNEITRQGGWPPGLIGEAYLNFGYFGLLFIPFLYGILIRVYYESFRPLLGRSFPATLIYSASLYPLAWSTFELNFALGILTTLFSVGPLVVMLQLCRSYPKGSSG